MRTSSLWRSRISSKLLRRSKPPTTRRTRPRRRCVPISVAPTAARFPPICGRVHVTITPEDTDCPCCRSPMHVIGEDAAERLDVIPAQYRVIVTHRPKYACRACEEAVVQAAAPERLCGAKRT
jgi:transposase